MKVGDTVIYIGKNTEFTGKIGTIFHVFNKTYVFISISDNSIYTSINNLKIVNSSVLDTE